MVSVLVWNNPTMSANLGARDLSTRRAWVALEPGGRGFAGYVERTDFPGHPLEEGGPWKTVAQALDWARARAAQVVLRYALDGDSVFSAGVRPYDGSDGPLPSWPPAPEVLEGLDAQVSRFREAYHEDPEALSTGELGGVAEPEVQRGRAPDAGSH